jgi:3-methyladenine DNA glycosylase AlkD
LRAKLRKDLLAAFREIADPARAAGAQAYMKSSMPFIGVAATPMRKACREVFAGHPIETAGEWRETVLGLWRGAKYREERYAAIELTGERQYRRWQTLQTLPMYEEMIVTGAWWDYVDVIASHRVGEYLLRDFPKEMKREMRRWSKSDDMWKRRTSILSQLTFKRDTDLSLLYDCIRPSLSSKEFFLRKAIGWALRQYAWTDPEEVKRYVREHENELSPLSKREALKNVNQASS